VKRFLLVTLGLLTLAAAPLPCRAQWGWPPPGYSTTGVRACDNSLYRGLCARLRDHRHGRHAGCAQPDDPPDGGIVPVPAATPLPPDGVPQPPPSAGARP
jgi:hypothetical protein